MDESICRAAMETDRENRLVDTRSGRREWDEGQEEQGHIYVSMC